MIGVFTVHFIESAKVVEDPKQKAQNGFLLVVRSLSELHPIE
jgi:hypothetical protein